MKHSMKIAVRATTCFVTGLLILVTSGCATYKSISEAEPGSAKIFSGTRLDIRAIGEDASRTSKFKTLPPEYPAVDLPFSFMADILIFPLTSSVALYEYLFE